MVKEYGREFPERPLMSSLSDALGIEHFTTSRGSTVRRDFLEAVADALGVLNDHAMDKDALIRSVWEAANRRPMPEDRLSSGGTVTNRVLQEVLDGIARHGTRLTRAQPDIVRGDEAVLDEAADVLDPTTLSDERSRRLAEQAVREGQDRFRTKVLAAYQDRCALTGTGVPAALDAAHIAPYRGKKSNQIINGIALRKDLHSLFDHGMLAIHEETYEVLLGPVLADSEVYGSLEGKTIRIPRLHAERPSRPALRSHRLWTGLGCS